MSNTTLFDLKSIRDSDLKLEYRRQAAVRLMKDNNADIREIVAQECVKNIILDEDLLVSWLKEEDVIDIRCYIFLALAQANAKLAIDLLEKTCAEKGSGSPLVDKELLYVYGGLAIARRSRKFQLYIIQYIYCKDRDIAEHAIALSRMLTDEFDAVTLNFIDLIVDSADKENRSE